MNPSNHARSGATRSLGIAAAAGTAHTTDERRTDDFDPNSGPDGATPVIRYATAAVLALGDDVLALAITPTVLARQDVAS